MDRGPARSVLREIETLYALGTLSGLTDAQLLERFLARNGDEAEAAFATLMHRHGPTVLGVCQRMLRGWHDAEDAFQATFLVLARRAASIGRRERLASWLYGVAVRTAKEARRRSARDRAIERRLMDVTEVETEPPGDREDLLPLLDEELSRLPERYRSALVACELEGKSRREAAQQLGTSEGTLSTHLARGRKLLRDRLLRRGVTLGVGPIVGLSPHSFEPVVPERLLGPTVRAAISHASGCGTAGTISQTASSLAERVVKMMVLARLTLIVAALMAGAVGALSVVMLIRPATAATPQAPVPREPGPDDLPGRVVDKTGAGVPGVEIWAMDGPGWTPETVVKTTTDAQGRFVVPWAQNRRGRQGGQNFSLLARSRDGSIGWQHPVWYNSADGKGVEVELYAVGDVRGRLTDQNARPIAGVEVAPVFIRSTANGIRLSPEPAALFRTMTGAEGSFVLKGIPHGAAISATIPDPAFGTPMVSWDTSQSVTIALDGRLGRINGRLKPPDARGLASQLPLWLRRSPRPDDSPPARFELICNRNTTADKDGTFQFDGLPPGRYVVDGDFDRDGLVATNPENQVEVGPGAVAPLEIPLQRLPMISGRIVDARTGKGIAGIGLWALWREAGRNMVVGEATTDAEGRYRIPARPGTIVIEPTQVPRTHLGLDAIEYPMLEAKADQTWPDLKFVPATSIDGIVVTDSGQPVAAAEVFLLARDRDPTVRHPEPLRTGPDGAFHFDQVDPDGNLSLWARAGDATTSGSVVVRPRELKGKVSLTIDPKSTVRIRGLVTDGRGKRISGAKVTLWWTRMYASDKGERKDGGVGSVLATETTRENGWFLFRGLWPDLSYRIEIEARGHGEVEAPKVTGKAGETHDLGKIILGKIDGYLGGRVVDSDGRPIVGAAVFNSGDGPRPIATSTDAEGRFRLEGLYAGTRYAFARKDGYRFTGVKVQDDTDGLTITLLKPGEPPPVWKPGDGPTYDQQRAFARRVLIRLWEQYNADAENNGASACVGHMAEIDPDLATQWSAEKGHAYDDQVRHAQARTLAETDATRALALLNQRADSESQAVLQTLADRFAESDPTKAVRFAEEAAVQSRGLDQPDRALAMARAGAVLVRLGRADIGRKLIDDAARDAARLPAVPGAGLRRARTAQILAPHDVERALAIIEPFKVADSDSWHSSRAAIAAAIARTDTLRAIALVDTVGGYGLDRERTRTAIAYTIGADRPDEAIKIIEGIKQSQWAERWQAVAFGWLAVALAPRDRARANALIDRALAMMMDHRERIRSGDEMDVAARVAVCARRIGYPDMDGAIMRVMAARSGGLREVAGDRAGFVQGITTAAIQLALIDPDAARTVLEQLEERPGIDPASLWLTRQPWLMAWALVDLEKAQAIFEAELTAFDREKRRDLWNAGFFETVELLTAPPERREAVLYRRSGGGYGWPGEEP